VPSACDGPFPLEGELERALSLEQLGQLEAAESVYREFIDRHGSHPIACHRLGVICGKTGRIEESFRLLTRTVAVQPDNADALSTLGVIHWMEGRIDAAIATQQQALLLRQGLTQAHSRLGVALAGAGRRVEAIESFREALRQDPAHLEALGNLGSMLLGEGEWHEAIDLLSRALAVSPGNRHLMVNLAQALHAWGQPQDAIKWYQEVLELAPDDSHLLANLGVAYQETGDFDRAVLHYQQSLVIRSNDAPTWFNLGTAFQERGDLEDAIRAFNVSLEHDSSMAKTSINLGHVFFETGDLTAAIKSFAGAVEAEPTNPDAHINLAHALLKAGDYSRAWDHFEWRFKTSEAQEQLHLPRLPRWDGSAGSTIDLMLLGEQGLGDVIQFMRFCHLIGHEVGSVSLCVPQPLVELARHSAVADRVYSPVEGEQVRIGQWMPLMSALRFLDLSVFQHASPAPYIHVPATTSMHWWERLREEGQPIVGIHWQGNPLTERGGLKGRSIPLKLFAPLCDRADLRLISLQKGFGTEQLDTCGFRERFVSCQEEINATWDFVATAAMVKACDLVITTDSALAHLAGGLGTPTWLLLHHSPDWRWGMDGERSHWYSSMRLFRQRTKGDWAEVMERVRAELIARV